MHLLYSTVYCFASLWHVVMHSTLINVLYIVLNRVISLFRKFTDSGVSGKCLIFQFGIGKQRSLEPFLCVFTVKKYNSFGGLRC